MAYDGSIHLLVLTPEKVELDIYVDKVTLPGSKGRFMILKNHAPLISSLEEGDVVYSIAGKDMKLHVLSGFVEINENEVTVCAEL